MIVTSRMAWSYSLTLNPMSNVFFISKLTGNVVARHMEEQLEHDDIHDSYQFAYQS